ncbi:MAG: bifunctional glutamate N-acetyltransferase/amino-acid acetyltransferase ArgJ [Anaerolineae bacterium]|nr:bifunctional glutamate N-acetyltransferase/amino-acid acetyltransferase ArgJ [Anaerolineae bacterium]
MTALEMSKLETSIDAVQGFLTAGVDCGLRNKPQPDLSIIASEVNCNAAGIFTTNQVKSAHVQYDMAVLKNDPTKIRAVVVNSKIANVCTGELGKQNTATMAALVAEKLGCESSQVLVMSTGVIGPQLPMDKISRGIDEAAQSLAPNGWDDAALGIMTTDTRPKKASIRCKGYTIAGIAKGSGMIAPNMATMLAVLVTDADVSVPVLNDLLRKAANVSFNRITVDGDTSTSDTVLFFANGQSGKKIESEDDVAAFESALTELCQHLAGEIVRDGEGATKFITIEVEGAPDDHAAWQIANTIACSPLVKTAFAGSDANWGRIMAAAGRAGVEFDQMKANLWFDCGMNGMTENALQVFKNGMPTDYEENDAAAIFAAPDISVKLQLDEGSGTCVVWTCDLSHEYVSINADYRT